MKLILAKDTLLEREFQFDIFKKRGIFTLYGNKIQNIKTIGIFVSGGLDSAALLCLILKELIVNNNIDKYKIICFTVDKGEGQVSYALNVVKEVERIFNIKLEHHILKNSGHTSRPGRIGTDTYKDISNWETNMILYQGINNVPPDEIIKFNSEFEGYNVEEVSYSGDKMLLFPFLKLHKPQILDILYQMECSSLIGLTQTCTERSNGTCGICYWCEERAWGFSVLGKKDPIINN